jgi:fluoride ion exporter CrcB/FEX
VLTASLVCALGCLVRYGSELLAGTLFSVQRLWGTLAVNVIGAAVVGFVLTHTLDHSAAIVPFCGGLTSFSAAFAGPLHAWHDGSRRSGLVALVATPVLCVAASAMAAAL